MTRRPAPQWGRHILPNGDVLSVTEPTVGSHIAWWAEVLAGTATVAMAVLILTLLLTPERCMSVNAVHLSDGAVTTLTSEGWYGRPDDGAERLYSPTCRERGRS